MYRQKKTKFKHKNMEAKEGLKEYLGHSTELFRFILHAFSTEIIYKLNMWNVLTLIRYKINDVEKQ